MELRSPSVSGLLPLSTCVFVVMTGFAMTLPALSFFTERLASGATSRPFSIELHIGLLTSVYAFAQLGFAPLWGAASDRIGRRRVIALGMCGFALTAVLFGISTRLWMLYGTRFLGGALSSAILPTAAAYVADRTSDQERARGMGVLNGAASLGGITGPALGGLLARKDLHLSLRFDHFAIDAFSLPFFASAALAIVALALVIAWVREPRRVTRARAERTRERPRDARHHDALAIVLLASFGGQLGISLFEATFTLLAQHRLGYGPAQVGGVFMVCGAVMAAIQLFVVGRISRTVGELTQATAGFVLLGAGLAWLAVAASLAMVAASVAILAAGSALAAPNLAAIVSQVGAERRGRALGTQSAAQSVGQVGGPLLGSALFGWWMAAPYVLASATMFGVALLLSLFVRARARRG